MTTPTQKQVQAFMESLGFEWRESLQDKKLGMWVKSMERVDQAKDRFTSWLTTHEAHFLYQAFQAQRTQLLKDVREKVLAVTSSHKCAFDERGVLCHGCGEEYKKEILIRELRQRLDQLEKGEL